MFLTGRLKELINRGGEKISPLEIDEILLRHPKIADAVSFGAEDSIYGQQVQAAVLLKIKTKNLKENQKIQEEILEFCRKNLAPFKIPQKIFITEKFPTTATGKIQRRHVAEEFSSNKKSKL